MPEDRTSVGSAPNLSLTDNLIMKRYRDAPVARGWLVDDDTARGIAEELQETYRIAAPSVDTEVRLLSGGNLQRAILAREIETKPGLLVAVQPTRGLDVGAIETVHRLLLDLRSKGAAILLISEELDEILALSDRVDVIYEGRVVGSFPSDEADIAHVGLLMTGGAEAASGESVAATIATARGPGVTIRLEPRLTVSRWLSPGLTIGARRRRAA